MSAASLNNSEKMTSVTGVYLLILFIMLLFSLSPLNINAHNKDSLRSGNFCFIENKGQWEAPVLYKAELEGGAIFIEKNRLTLTFGDINKIKEITSFKYLPQDKKKAAGIPDNKVNFHSYHMNFKGCNPAPVIKASDENPEYNNYFIGNDPKKWTSKVKKYKKVLFENIYSGINLNIYEKDFLFKYDFTIAPGADVKDIVLEYEGAEKLYLEDKNLVIKTTVNRVVELKPNAWQQGPDGITEVECNFKLKGNKVSFHFPKGYNHSLPLIIDPVLIFASYSGSTADNWGYTATYDQLGFLYAGGNVFAIGYPVTTGAYQTYYAGASCDIAISKYDTTGSFLIYSTYLGGSGTEVPNSLITSSNNELFILGTSGSQNFPVTSGAFDNSFNGGTNFTLTYVLQYSQGSDIVISRLSSDGTALLSSTYVGGSGNDGLNIPWPLKHNYADEVRGEIMIDKNDNIYVVSSTRSQNFPVTANSFQTTFGGGQQDGCVFKMDYTLSNMIWSSYIGGTQNEGVYSVVLDDYDNLYIAGGTTSHDFPTTANSLHPSYIGGSSDGFITHIENSGSQILQSTYFGGSHYDQIYFVENDRKGYIYVLGQIDTSGTALIQNAAWNTPDGGQFISKLSPMLNYVVWSTTFGTGSKKPDISPTAFLVDLCNKIYLSGWGGPSLNGFGGTQGMPITSNAFQTTTDNNDYYFMVMEDDASAINYGSYYGGSSSEHVDGGTSRFDKKGRIYQSVCAGCGGYDDFPTTPGAVSNTNNSTNCNNGVIKIDFNLPVVVADFIKPPAICLPANVTFTNTSYISSSSGYTCFWNFGDGQTSTQCNPTHTYTSAGIYNATLIVHDFGACNVADTISQQVVVLANSTSTLSDKKICLGDYIQIGLLPIPDPSISYQWIPTTGLSNPNISNPIASPSTTTNYTLLINNGICTDTIKQNVLVSELIVDAGSNQMICSGQTVNLTAFTNTGNSTFQWSDNPGFTNTLNSSPNDSSITVTLNNTQTFYVKAVDPLCEDIDSITVSVSVAGLSAGIDKNICEGDTINLTATNLYPGNPLNYAWAPTSAIISGANTSSPLVSPAVTTTYTVTGANIYGCKAYDTIIVYVTIIQPNLTSADVLCYGQCNGQISVTPAGGSSPYSFNWSNGSTNSTLNNLCHGLYSVIITDNKGCEKSASQNIQQPDSISVAIVDTTGVVCNGVCGGSATVMATGGVPQYFYSWINGQTGPTAINLCAGTYYVYVTDSNSCQKITKVEIFDTSNFNATVNNTSPACYGYCDGSAAANPSAGVPPYEYLWGGGQTTQTITGLCAGNYNVSITESQGCLRNVYTIITEPDELNISTPVITNPLCKGSCDGKITISATGGVPPYSYLWSNGQTTATATNLCEGTYIVTITDNNGCKKTTSSILTDPPELVLSISPSNTPCAEYCGGTSQASISGGTIPYFYSWSNGQSSSQATDLCAGVVTLTITDNNGCKITAANTVSIVSSFPPGISATTTNDTIYNGQSTQLNATLLQGYTYSWFPTGGLNNTAIPDPIASPSSTTSYVVTIKDAWGCEYSDTVTICVLEVTCDEAQIYVPNAFTPNNDGKNDILYVRSNVLTDVHLSIYDRWGENVFETYDLKQGWNGNYKDKPCDPGVFVYYIDATCIDNATFKKKGNITLIR